MDRRENFMEPYVFFFALVLDTQKKESRDASKTMVTRCHQMSPVDQWIPTQKSSDLWIQRTGEKSKWRTEELR